MPTYFITGSTGTVGRQVVNALLEQGANVIAASRNTERSESLFGDSVSHVHFDFENPDTFSIPSHVDGIFLLGPPLNPQLFELLTPFTDHLLNNGPSRIVYLSADGLDHYDFLDFHSKMEAKLKASDADWRIVKPGFFMQNFGNYERESILERKVIFSPAGSGKTAFVSAGDIGRSVAALLQEDKYKHQSFALTGAEVLTHFDVAQMLSDLLGEEIAYANPTPEIYKAVLSDAGAPDFIADYMLAVYDMIKSGKVENVSNDVELLTGRKPEKLIDVLKRDFEAELAESAK